MTNVELEWGQETVTAELPETAEVFVPGETVPDPAYLEDVHRATRASIEDPLGMSPIAGLVGRGDTVTISFPDRVKGGFQETSHRKVAIPILVDECLKAGVREEDISLVCSNGLHRKNTPDELRSMLGENIFERFSPDNRIVNHDSEDEDQLVDLGQDSAGNRVIMNKRVFESDLPILIGHVLGNPYGGYSGGYKMAATGITHWRSIAAHHVPEVMHAPDFTPVSTGTEMRRRMDSIGQHMEERMGRKFFMCDAVLDTRQRQIAVFSGHGVEVQKASWEAANRRTYVPWARERFDVMIFGLPQKFHYGDGHGTNPILILQAIAANVIRHRRVLNDRFVVIAASACDGYFNDQTFPSYRELFERFRKGGHHTLPELQRYAEAMSTNEKYIRGYRFEYGYHPFHAFSMIACGHIAEQQAAAIYIVGAKAPEYARAMGMKTRATVSEAMADAAKIVGSSPRVLALPRAFLTAPVHLMMSGDRAPRID